MNIAKVNSNVVRLNLRQNEPTEKPETGVNFKGALGDKFVKEIANGSHVSTETIMESIKGSFGLSKDKVKDVIEAFATQFKQLTNQNNNLILKNSLLQKDLSKKDNEIKEIHRRNSQWERDELRSLGEKLRLKDKQIEELKKFESMALVKSVDEIGVLMPDQIIETLNAAVANDLKAQNSLFEYIMTGKGQEDFLKQIEYNNIISKAKMDGMTDIPEVKNALESTRENLAYPLGFHQGILAANYLEKTLKNNPKGEYIMAKSIQDLVKNNSEALFSSLRDNDMRYKSIDGIIQESVEYYKNIQQNKEKLLNDGYKFIGTEHHQEKNKLVYKFFDTENEGLREYFGNELANGWLGCGRYTAKDGSVRTYTGEWK